MPKSRKHSGKRRGTRKSPASKRRMTRRMRGGETYAIGEIVHYYPDKNGTKKYRAKIITTNEIPGDFVLTQKAHKELYPILKNAYDLTQHYIVYKDGNKEKLQVVYPFSGSTDKIEKVKDMTNSEKAQAQKDKKQAENTYKKAKEEHDARQRYIYS